ncbi:ABC transporter substrate-binding protein [uncultured Gemmiger sp.]|uniref:ABC transporter substrate-binding protein n=1 Tax=uncultured Gemmiger sp. TaxID=1623490 RepID=UPI002616BF8B|nr:ABC transporter substrate-binding protein [uncultured Gemmiger sp.]
MKLKKITAAALAGAMALSLAACGSSNSAAASTADASSTAESTTSETSGDKKLTVTWWGNQTRNERTIATLDLYAEQNSGVTFDPQVAEWADYWNKLATASAGKALPDIIQMDYKYLDQYIKNGLLTELTSYVEDGTLDVSNIDEGILNTGKGADGGLYAICIGENAPALVYNKTLLDENGITVKDNMTVDEFKALCKEVYEKTGYKSNYYYNQGENNLEYVLRAKDITLFEDGKLGAASADDFNQYFGVFEDGIKEGWMLPASSFAERNIGTIEQDPLVYGSDPANRSWCTFLWTNSLSAIQAAAPDSMELGITTWPSDNTQKSNYLKPGQFFCVSSDSKDPAEAAKVINFFTNSVDANKILLAERGVPASTEVADAIAPELDEGTQKGMTFIKDVIAPNCSQINVAPPEGTSEAINLLKQLEEQLCYGQITAQEASEQFFTQGNAFLAAKAG